MANTTTEIIYIGKSQQVESNGCYAISFFRPTTSNAVSVEGLPLEAGQTFAIKQNVGDRDYTIYDIVFTSGSSTNEMYVMRTNELG